MGRLRTRLAKLEGGRVPPGECDGAGNTYLLNDDSLDPARVPGCRRCGGQHAVVIREVVVSVDDLRGDTGASG